MEKSESLVRDIYVASALYAHGARFVGLQKDSNFYWFIFEDKESCEKLIQKYWRKEAVLPPKVYADSIKTMKDRLFSQR